MTVISNAQSQALTASLDLRGAAPRGIAVFPSRRRCCQTDDQVGGDRRDAYPVKTRLRKRQSQRCIGWTEPAMCARGSVVSQLRCVNMTCDDHVDVVGAEDGCVFLKGNDDAQVEPSAQAMLIGR